MKKILSLALGVAIVFAYVTQVAVAQRVDQARWIDATTLQYQDKYYFDREPFDGDRDAERTEEGCSSQLSYNGDRTKADADLRKKNDFGCTEKEEINDIVISNPRDGFIMGYRKDGSTVQIYKPAADETGTPPTLVTFRSSSSGEKDTYYFDNNGTLNKNVYIKIGADGEFSDESSAMKIVYGDINDFRLAAGGAVAAQPTEITNATVGATDGVNGAGGDERPSCEVNGESALSWIICPVINGLAIVGDGIFDNFVFPFLDRQLITTDPESGLYKTWSGFRIFGNIFLVGGLLVIAGAQGLGKE